jgi:hypothetical protein
LAQQLLPTDDVLEHRNIDRSSTCSVCRVVVSWWHSLIECNMANSVGMLSNDLMVDLMIACREANAKNWLFHLLDTFPHDQFTRLFVMLWAIWTLRRKAINEVISSAPSFLGIRKILTKLSQ